MVWMPNTQTQTRAGVRLAGKDLSYCCCIEEGEGERKEGRREEA